jgi:ribose 5-phosphate isomerase A
MNAAPSSANPDRDALKRAAAEAAVQLVENDMIVGLGSGSTAAFAVEALARRHRQGLRFVGIPTSERTAAQAKAADIPLTSFSEHRQIDLTIDGADEVERGTLNLIKGLGGALLREKIAPPRVTALRSWSTAARWWIGLGREHRSPSKWWTSAWRRRANRSKCSAPALARACHRARPSLPIAATVFLIAISAASPIRRDWRGALGESSAWWKAGFSSAAPIRSLWPTPPASTGSTVRARIGAVRRSLVVMGVSASGKSTIADELSARLGWPFEEGDSLHPESNVAKMHVGIPLTDADRLPWLERVAAWIDGQRARKQPGIVSCSALKRAYRQIIIGDRPEVRLVYLRGGRSLIAEHLAGRHGHFMPSALLQSQIDTLEEPDPSEDPLTVDAGAPAEQVADEIIRLLGASATVSQGAAA